MDWPKVKLSTVVEILDSMRKPVKAGDRIEGPYPYYGANGQQGTINDFIFDEPLILVAEDGGHFFDPSRPIAYRIEGKTWVNNHAHVLRCNPDMDISYLCHQLAGYNVEPYLTGSTRAKLTKGALERIPITKPPLNEQKRIAAILDKANEIKHAQNSAFNMRQKLINSTFESLFGPYFVNVDSFVELGELVESVRVGYVGPTSKHYRDQGVHYLRTGNVGHGSVITDGMKYITQEFHDSQKKSKLKTGDIVISRVIGDEIKCSIIPPELDDSNCGNVVIVTPSRQMNSIFLCHLILSHHTQRKLMRRKVGSAQSVVNTKVMKKMLVPKIPIQLQEQFAVIVESISRLQDPRHLSQKHSDSLIQDLLS